MLCLSCGRQLKDHRLHIRGLTIKYANSPPCACCGNSGQKPQYGLMKLAYQRFTAVLLLIYGSLFLSGVYYCPSVFWCAVARMSELLVKLGKSGSKIREMLVQVYGDGYWQWDTNCSNIDEHYNWHQKSDRRWIQNYKQIFEKLHRLTLGVNIWLSLFNQASECLQTRCMNGLLTDISNGCNPC
jgi:hypothetical protein